MDTRWTPRERLQTARAGAATGRPKRGRPKLSLENRAWRTLIAYTHFLAVFQWLRLMTRLYGVEAASDRIHELWPWPDAITRMGLGRLARALAGAVAPHSIAVDHLARLHRVSPRTIQRWLAHGRRLWPDVGPALREGLLTTHHLRAVRALRLSAPPTNAQEQQITQVMRQAKATWARRQPISVRR